MAIANSSQTIHPGFGAPAVNVSQTAINVPINATTNVLSGATFPSVTFRSGRVHLKFTGFPASTQVTAIVVTVTDGTTTEYIANIPTYAANQRPNLLVDFITDLALNSVSVSVTLANAGTAATADCEVIAST